MKISQIIIEGHDEEQMQNLFEEIQNKYSLYDNSVLNSDVPEQDTILEKGRIEETGNITVHQLKSSCGCEESE